MASAARSQLAPQPPRLQLRLEQQRRPKITPGQICRDLERLCEMGLIEAFRDEYNIVRYRTVKRA